MEEREYITKENDRWDIISTIFYGRPDMFHFIQQANQHIPPQTLYSPLLPAGIKLYIPEIEEETKKVYVPSWKL